MDKPWPKHQHFKSHLRAALVSNVYNEVPALSQLIGIEVPSIQADTSARSESTACCDFFRVCKTSISAAIEAMDVPSATTASRSTGLRLFISFLKQVLVLVDSNSSRLLASFLLAANRVDNTRNHGLLL